MGLFVRGKYIVLWTWGFAIGKLYMDVRFVGGK